MTSVVGATVHSIVVDAKIRQAEAGSGRASTASTSTRDSTSGRKTETSPLFGDEGEDESEEGEMWEREKRKDEEAVEMKVRDSSSTSTMGALSKLCLNGEEDGTSYEKLP